MTDITSSSSASAAPRRRVMLSQKKSPPYKPPWLILLALAVVIALFGAIFIFLNMARPHFTIGRGDSLISHMRPKSTTDVDAYLRGIKAAEKIHLPVYMVEPGGTRTAITYPYARSLARSTNWVKVDARLYPGDTIDLRWGGKFTPAYGRPAAQYR